MSGRSIESVPGTVRMAASAFNRQIVTFDAACLFCTWFYGTDFLWFIQQGGIGDEQRVIQQRKTGHFNVKSILFAGLLRHLDDPVDPGCDRIDQHRFAEREISTSGCATARRSLPGGNARLADKPAEAFVTATNMPLAAHSGWPRST